MFSSLIQKKLSEMVEHNIGKYQMEFRSNISTTENIHIVRQIYEKCFEYQIDLSNIFIGFEQAFDSMKRSAISKSLDLFSVPSKLIRLIKLTLSKCRSEVKINNDSMEQIEINLGVRQGDSLFATFLCLVIDTVMRKLDLRGNINTRFKQMCAYADDILITASTKQALNRAFNKLTDEVEKLV